MFPTRFWSLTLAAGLLACAQPPRRDLGADPQSPRVVDVVPSPADRLIDENDAGRPSVRQEAPVVHPSTRANSLAGTPSIEQKSEPAVAYESPAAATPQEAAPARTGAPLALGAPAADGEVNAMMRSVEQTRAAAKLAVSNYPYTPPPVVTPGTEDYQAAAPQGFLRPTEAPLSTFSADVDTASYANVRRFVTSGALPPPEAVRVEELVNYFPYRYPRARRGEPFGVRLDMAAAPWNPAHRLVRIGIRAEDVTKASRKASNLVFLLDVSGSMSAPNKLPLVVESLQLLTAQLDARDRVTIVVYAGASGLVLPPTRGDRHAEIAEALARLSAGGSTNGGAGISLAYAMARRCFIAGGVNRVILATDGDFNVGVTSPQALVDLVKENAASGVFLTVLGFGMGNLKDATLEQIADQGNGAYAYVDTRQEARKLFVEQLGGTLQTVAKDVKFQVEFNPAAVAAYRLIGYDNRRLADHEFNDDRVDAGDVGAGHTVTALYEIVPVGGVAGVDGVPGVDPLKYQPEKNAPRRWFSRRSAPEALTLKIRYKAPDGARSRLLTYTLRDDGNDAARRDDDFRFAAAVAAWGMVLQRSADRGDASLDLALRLATSAVGDDPQGHRAEFVALVQRTRALTGTPVWED